MNLIQQLENEEIERLGKSIPEFAPGDTVIVSVNVVEGTRKRVQAMPAACRRSCASCCADWAPSDARARPCSPTCFSSRDLRAR